MNQVEVVFLLRHRPRFQGRIGAGPGEMGVLFDRARSPSVQVIDVNRWWG